jgi:hypothetical protein
MFNLSTILGAWVPFPAPGGPNRIKMFLGLAAYLELSPNMFLLAGGSEELLERHGPIFTGLRVR